MGCAEATTKNLYASTKYRETQLGSGEADRLGVDFIYNTGAIAVLKNRRDRIFLKNKFKLVVSNLLITIITCSRCEV